MQVIGDADMDVVSIHAPRCRGAMQVVREQIAHRLDVSIHAPRCRGAMLTNGHQAQYFHMFQSTPPVAEGRCRTAKAA